MSHVVEMCRLQHLEGMIQVEERVEQNNVKTIKDEEIERAL
jgi:hypothetical protein